MIAYPIHGDGVTIIEDNPMATFTLTSGAISSMFATVSNEYNTFVCTDDDSRVSFTMSGVRAVEEEGGFGKAQLELDRWNDRSKKIDANGIPSLTVTDFTGKRVSLHILGEDNDSYWETRVLGIRELEHDGQLYCYRSTFDLSVQLKMALDMQALSR